MRNKQIDLEMKYNKKHLVNVIPDEYYHLLEGKSVDRQQIIIDMLYMLLQKDIQPIQNAVSLVSSRGYSWEEAIDLIDKESEADKPLFSLVVNKTGSITVNSNVRPTVAIVEAKKYQGVMPPLIVPPNKWTTHYNGGYYTQRHSAILGSSNQHDDYIALGTLNKLQDIPWKFNNTVMLTYSDNVVYDKNQALNVYSELWGESFYFMWQFDKRGRMYSKGYEVNLQGTEYHKAVLDFAVGEKLTSTGEKSLVTAIANSAGYDKLKWNDRLTKGYELINDHVISQPDGSIDIISDGIDEPMLFTKYVEAFINYASDNSEIFCPVSLDATASGIQVLSCLTGCVTSASAVNLTKTGKREDVYTHIAGAMNKSLGTNDITRKYVKKPFMTHWYSSKALPKKIFGDGDVLEAFYDTLDGQFPGPERFMDTVNALWTDKEEFVFTAPDGHKAVIRMSITETATVELAEGVEFDYEYSVQQANNNPRHLCANITHMYDGWVAREVINRCDFHVATIHDSFWCHPNNVPKLSQVYREVLSDLAKGDYLERTLSELAGRPITFHKESDELPKLILESEYALS